MSASSLTYQTTNLLSLQNLPQQLASQIQNFIDRSFFAPHHSWGCTPLVDSRQSSMSCLRCATLNVMSNVALPYMLNIYALRVITPHVHASLQACKRSCQRKRLPGACETFGRVQFKQEPVRNKHEDKRRIQRNPNLEESGKKCVRLISSTLETGSQSNSSQGRTVRCKKE